MCFIDFFKDILMDFFKGFLSYPKHLTAWELAASFQDSPYPPPQAKRWTLGA
jgi:hypothetical protein